MSINILFLGYRISPNVLGESPDSRGFGKLPEGDTHFCSQPSANIKERHIYTIYIQIGDKNILKP